MIELYRESLKDTAKFYQELAEKHAGDPIAKHFVGRSEGAISALESFDRYFQPQPILVKA